MKSFRTLTVPSLALALLFLCGSRGLTAGTAEVINETAVGPTEIGYVEAAISRYSHPLGRGSIVISLASLGEALPPSPSCSTERGCGFVTALKPRFTVNGCSPPTLDGNQRANFAFGLSGTFCQQPNGAWSYSGSFSVTSSDGSPAVGNGTVEAAGGENGQSIVTLSGVLAQ
jgi:hypothetical protein